MHLKNKYITDYNNLQKKYLESLKKFDEVILMKKELYGEKAESVIIIK